MNVFWLWFFLTWVDPLFVSADFSYRLGKIPTVPQNVPLEIGDANGHDDTLTWMRFRPIKDGVEVLLIEFDGGRKSYTGKWPADEVPVTVKLAKISAAEYSQLCLSLTMLNAMEIRPHAMGSGIISSQDFWVNAQLGPGKKPLVLFDWAGYWSSESRIDFMHAQLAVQVAQSAVPPLLLRKHELTADERKWASEKFSRDWEVLKEKKSHWFVRNRYLMMIGVVGNESALPTLRKAMSADPKELDVYLAINAITRLTKIDVRPQPVTNMDLKTTREKLIEALDKKK